MSTGSTEKVYSISHRDLVNYVLFLGLLAIVGFFAYRSGDSKAKPLFGPSVRTCPDDCNCQHRRPFLPNGQTGQQTELPSPQK